MVRGEGSLTPGSNLLMSSSAFSNNMKASMRSRDVQGQRMEKLEIMDYTAVFPIVYCPFETENSKK